MCAQKLFKACISASNFIWFQKFNKQVTQPCRCSLNKNERSTINSSKTETSAVLNKAVEYVSPRSLATSKHCVKGPEKRHRQEAERQTIECHQAKATERGRMSSTTIFWSLLRPRANCTCCGKIQRDLLAKSVKVPVP